MAKRRLPVVPAKAAALELEGADGGRVRLESLWAGQPAVVVFLRHFG
jgi:hypothetical protein